LFYDAVRVADCMASNVEMIDEQWIEKDSAQRGLVAIVVLSQHLGGRTEEKHYSDCPSRDTNQVLLRNYGLTAKLISYLRVANRK
jgi:hypothetical protein